jgi:hypothetical protein
MQDSPIVQKILSKHCFLRKKEKERKNKEKWAGGLLN